MTDYNKVAHTSNTEAKKETKEERPKVERVAVAKKRKPKMSERLVRAIAGPDGIPSVSQYISKEIIIPAAKDLFVNAIQSGISMMVYGHDKPAGGSGAYRATSSYRAPSTNYGNRYQAGTPANNSQPNYSNKVTNTSFNSMDYAVASRQEALHVMENMQNLVADYGIATISDFYDMLGVETTFADSAFGWASNLDNNATVVSVRDGFAVRLPRPEPVSR